MSAQYNATSFGLKSNRLAWWPIVSALIAAASVVPIAAAQEVADFFPERSHLYASDGLAGDFFGYAVSISGDRLVVGASSDDTTAGGIDAGSAYVFERSGGGSWTQVAHLYASDGLVADYFGDTVSISGDRMVVGAAYSNTAGGSNAGSAYVFERSGGGSWTQVAHLYASDGLTNDYFGGEVSISGDRLVVGASSDDTTAGGINAGSAYVFDAVSVINMDYPAWASSDLASEIDRASTGDNLALRARAMLEAPDILNASAKRLTYVGVEPLTIPTNVMMTVGNLSVFADGLGLADGGLTLEGKLVAPQDGTLSFQELTVTSGGQLLQNGALLLVNDFVYTRSGGTCYLDGQVLADVVATTPGGEHRVSATTDVFGDYDNAGATIIQRGILYIYGTLTNTGTITGDYNNGLVPPTPGDGYAIGGDYIVGAGASLILPDPVWWLRVGGNVDIAIDDAARFVMHEATLEMTGVSASSLQTLEVLSQDLGASEAGFAASNFPIGALRISPGSTTTLVDVHINSSEAGPGTEVLYIDQLHVPVGATLVTKGSTIYAHAATIAGTVSNPDDIVIVQACMGDVNADGVVNGVDLAYILTTWGTDGQGAVDSDLDNDGTVNGVDLGLMLSAWGVCG